MHKLVPSLLDSAEEFVVLICSKAAKGCPVHLFFRSYAFPFLDSVGQFILGLFVPNKVPVDVDGGGIGAEYEFAFRADEFVEVGD